MMIVSRTRPLALALLLLPVMAGHLGAQSSSDQAPVQSQADWNTGPVVELMERARERRSAPRADSGLANYQARASGHIYFFLDRTDTDDRALVRVDQVDLEIYWSAPDLTKQRIIGLRNASKLPNRMNYHLDHLTVVQDEFGDIIRLGDGDEVRDVMHPAARHSAQLYDFRLADSMMVQLHGSSDPIRIHEVEVRPRHPDRPGFVGSIYLDQATASIVRMNFTFTPASYVDKRLDYINVSLDNGLWDGRYWLPNEQVLEIRRQVPVLDFPAGGVIRGVVRVRGYEFNQPLPPHLFRGSRIVAAPAHRRERHNFESGIYDQVEAEGLSTSMADLATIRRQAASLVARQYLSGLPRLRFYLPNSSAALRYNRAESLFLGGGLSYRTGRDSRIRATTGYAFGPGHLSSAAEWGTPIGDRLEFGVRVEDNALHNIGGRTQVPGVINTLSSAFAGKDNLDPYYRTGIRLGIERELAGEWSAALEVGYGTDRSAHLEDRSAPFNRGAKFRTVYPITEGEGPIGSVRVSHGTNIFSPWTGSLSLAAGRISGSSYFRPVMEVSSSWQSSDLRTGVAAGGAAGLVTGTPPAQQLFLLGGPGTIPGYTTSSFAGDRFALLEIEASHEVIEPWLSLRAVGAAGWSAAHSTLPPEWQIGTTGGIRPSLGAGIGFFYDILRLDLMRGLRHGHWQWVISVGPGLADIL